MTKKKEELDLPKKLLAFAKSARKGTWTLTELSRKSRKGLTLTLSLE
jgi:hypothetical protein